MRHFCRIQLQTDVFEAAAAFFIASISSVVSLMFTWQLRVFFALFLVRLSIFPPPLLDTMYSCIAQGGRIIYPAGVLFF